MVALIILQILLDVYLQLEVYPDMVKEDPKTQQGCFPGIRTSSFTGASLKRDILGFSG